MSFQTTISTHDLNANLTDDNWCLFDCRFILKDPHGGRKKYDQGHLPGAQYANLDEDLSSPAKSTTGRHPLPDANTLIEKLQRWGVNNDSQVVCYDDVSGAFGARMWWLLRWLGHRDVAVLDGGIDRWVADGLPLTTDVPTRPRGTFSGTPDDDLWVDIGFVQQRLAADEITLLDARSHERFAAIDKKTDPVPGHVPGANNYPFANNLDDGGKFLPREQLRTRFAAVFADHQPHEIINMCGSGVTACHNLLAMHHAGFPQTRLYVGSWSEWIKDPARPVATGEV